MGKCARCGRRQGCVRPCEAVERLLPKDETGKDAHREINVDTEVLAALAGRYAQAVWSHAGPAAKAFEPDMGALSARERKAVRNFLTGMSQRESAARLKISRLTLRTLLNRAFGKLRVAHLSQLAERKNGRMEKEAKHER